LKNARALPWGKIAKIRKNRDKQKHRKAEGDIGPRPVSYERNASEKLSNPRKSLPRSYSAARTVFSPPRPAYP
jgi:hypothetical protein